MNIDVMRRDRIGAIVVGLTIGVLAGASVVRAEEVVTALVGNALSWPGFAVWTALLFRREISGAIRRLRRFKIGDDGQIEGMMDAHSSIHGTDYFPLPSETTDELPRPDA